MESNKETYRVREAVKDDCYKIIELIKMSARENNMDMIEMDAKTLIRDGFTIGKSPSFKCLVCSGDNQHLFGYLFYCYTYSTWEGQVILMLNIFVDPQFRKMSIGKKMITKLAQIAYAENIPLIDKFLQDWNQSCINFHQSLGAVNLTNKEGWNIFQCNKNVIKQLACKTLESNAETHQIREAVKDDCYQIIETIKMLAHYHEMEDAVQIDAQTLIQDGFNNEKIPKFECLVSCDANQRLSGYLICHYTYSVYKGRGIWIEDLFVDPLFRKMENGKKMIIRLTQIAHSENIAFINGSIMDWNKFSRDFFKSLGAVNLTKKEGWNIWRFDKNTIQQLATDRAIFSEQLLNLNDGS